MEVAGLILLAVGLTLFILSIAVERIGCVVAVLGVIFGLFGVILVSNADKGFDQEPPKAITVVENVERFQVDTTVTIANGVRDTTYTLKCWQNPR